jgi:glycosyltransferase involved in cell wall biosynthesis
MALTTESTLRHGPGPLVSCFIPAYNKLDFLQEAIESIRSQTYPRWECLVIDDCSTDGTWRYLQSLDDPRFSVRRMEVNCHVATTGNLALRLARGKYLARLDQDDIALPDRFEAQVDFMERNPHVWVVGGRSIWFGARDGLSRGGPPIDAQIKANFLLAVGNISNPASMLRLEPVRSNGICYDPQYPLSCDYGLWVECMFAGAVFANLEQPVIKYRLHADQGSHSKDEIRRGVRRVRLQILQRWFPFLTGREMDAAEPILHTFGPPRLTLAQVRSGIAACDKILACPVESVMGEDRNQVLAYVKHMRDQWAGTIALR